MEEMHMENEQEDEGNHAALSGMFVGWMGRCRGRVRRHGLERDSTVPALTASRLHPDARAALDTTAVGNTELRSCEVGAGGQGGGSHVGACLGERVPPERAADGCERGRQDDSS